MNIEFKGKQLANYLERYLYACPNCQQIGKMYSNEDRFSCRDCLYEVKYTNKGLFEQGTHQIKFYTISAWGDWQKNLLDAIFYDILAEELARRDMENEGVDQHDAEELNSRIDDYYREFEKNGLDTVNVDLS